MKDMAVDVAAYFRTIPEPANTRLHAIRNLVFSILPEAEECIKYGIPTVLWHGNLVHYAGFKKHVGFYPVPSAMEAFQEELAPYPQGKGSVQFPLNAELPLELIERMVRFRIEEQLAVSRKKTGKKD